MKYLIFDLDATLLNKEKKITLMTQEVLRKASSKGYKIVVNTARTLPLCKDFQDVVRFDYYITDGGALIYDSEWKLLFSNLISKEMVRKVIDEMHRDKIASRFQIHGVNKIYTEDKSYALLLGDLGEYKDLSNFSCDATRIIMNTFDYSYLENIANKYRLIYTNYENSEWNGFSFSSKALGNQELKNILNDSSFYTICFGDDLGDLEMLKEANVGVAMVNSQSLLLKSISLHTTYTNDEDGCARYIEEMMLV